MQIKWTKSTYTLYLEEFIMVYRTKTYLAAEWDGDNNAITQLKKWNDSKYWSLSFTDAHDLTQARDTSLNCNIKTSLGLRLDASKTFIIIIGDHTKSVTNGSCQFCSNYSSYTKSCSKRYSVNYNSYIDYECNKAVKDKLNVIALYNAAVVNRNKCPDVIKRIGTHNAMQYIENGQRYWDYEEVKKAISG